MGGHLGPYVRIWWGKIDLLSSWLGKHRKQMEIGDTVKTIRHATYDKKVPPNTIGKIVKIRLRYSGTLQEYKQYKVEFDEYPTNIDNVDNLYYEENISRFAD